jgi:hypothetical protein
MYAGAQGELLSRISGIRIWCVSSNITGIEFCHGSSSMMLGNPDPVAAFGTADQLEASRETKGPPRQYDFNIDGANGEYITEVFVLPEPELSYIKVSVHSSLLY